MALINCSECNAQISNKASTCPKCGNPISSENIVTHSNLVTTQETSKTLKMHTLLSALVMIIGFSMMIVNAQSNESSPLAGLLVFVGLVWLIATKFRIWWHHK